MVKHHAMGCISSDGTEALAKIEEIMDSLRFFPEFLPNLVMANSQPPDRSPHHTTATS